MEQGDDESWRLESFTPFNQLKHRMPSASHAFQTALYELYSEEQRYLNQSDTQNTTVGQIVGSRKSALPISGIVGSQKSALPHSGIVGSQKSALSAMGKIESRSLCEDDNEKIITNGHFNHTDIKPVNTYNNGKNHPVVMNGKHQNVGKGENLNSKSKTKKLLTSRTPRTPEEHKVIVTSQLKDTSFYENEFRRRSMSESHAQLRKQLLERRLKISEGSEDISHHVTWADNSGVSLTSELRRRCYSNGSKGLPNKPILKKLTNEVSTDSDSSLLHVDTRYI